MTRRMRMYYALAPVFGLLGQPGVDVNVRNAKARVAKNDAVFEAYLYSLVLLSLNQLQWNIVAVPAQGLFRFRRAPGELKSTPGKFSYVEFTTPKAQYELHCDTRVDTRSPGACLEIDILVVPKKHADRQRHARKRPSYRKVRLLMEAKYHKGGIGTVEAKSFVGICASVRCAGCVDRLVTSGVVSDNARLLLQGVTPPLSYHPEITPLLRHQPNTNGLIASLVAAFPAAL